MLRFQTLLLITLFVYSGSKAQQFSEVAISLGIDFAAEYQFYGAGVSTYDWNKDGLDDLSFCTTGAPRFFENTGTGFNELSLNIPNSHEAKCIVWVDYDNDGDADVFLTRMFGPWSLYQNNGSLQFTDVTNISGLGTQNLFESYGANFGDVNNDGWLDLYISIRDLTNTSNMFYLSNGDGTFTQSVSALGIDNGFNLSFQGVFFDANLDGWPDLHLITDKICCENALYLNDGSGSFSDISASSGINISIDAMSNSIADYDNDGDLDIYVTNVETGNFLLENNGDETFTNVASTMGLTINEFCWGAVWLDYNLDGFQDLFSTTGSNLHVPVDNVLYQSSTVGDSYEIVANSGFVGKSNLSHCVAMGDFNSDGAPDIVLSNRDTGKVEVWFNNETNHNYLRVGLVGVQSNRDGIGSTMRCYTNGDIIQMRHTYCGEQYMSQNSQFEIFGLGSETTVDTLTITWSSGSVDRYYNVDANQTITVVEGSSLLAVGINDKLDQDNPKFIVQNDHLRIVDSDVFLIAIFDAQGKKVVDNATPLNNVIPINNLARGVYILSFHTKDGVAIKEKVLLN